VQNCKCKYFFHEEGALVGILKQFFTDSEEELLRRKEYALWRGKIRKRRTDLLNQPGAIVTISNDYDLENMIIWASPPLLVAVHTIMLFNESITHPSDWLAFVPVAVMFP
jgi:hypothetical protein